MSKEIVLEVKDEKKQYNFLMCFLLISSLWCLSLIIIVIADNKHIDLRYRLYIYILFYPIFPNAYNTKIYSIDTQIEDNSPYLNETI